MEKSKRVWVQPELIVIARSQPEEAVLESCKHDEFATSEMRDYMCNAGIYKKTGGQFVQCTNTVSCETFSPS